MKNVLLLSLVVLAGCDFVGGDEGVPVPLAQIRVDTLPLRAWDVDGTADILVEVQLASGRAIFRSEVYEDALPTTALVIDVEDLVEVSSPTFPLYVTVYDVDGSSLLDAELMARSEPFLVTELEDEVLLRLGDALGRSTRFTVATASIPEPAPTPTP